jgi:hypothetical protein
MIRAGHLFALFQCLRCLRQWQADGLAGEDVARLHSWATATSIVICKGGSALPCESCRSVIQAKQNNTHVVTSDACMLTSDCNQPQLSGYHGSASTLDLMRLPSALQILAGYAPNLLYKTNGCVHKLSEHNV